MARKTAKKKDRVADPDSNPVAPEQTSPTVAAATDAGAGAGDQAAPASAQPSPDPDPEAGFILRVTGPRKGRYRAGRRFDRTPVNIPLAELGEEAATALRDDPRLTCEILSAADIAALEAEAT